MKAHWQYFKYVLRHKWFVFLACRKLGVPLWQAIIHDWTKFTPGEWFPYVHGFYNPDGSKRQLYVATKIRSEDGWTMLGYRYQQAIQDAFDRAWLHHQKVNPHHWQYWVLINDEDGTVPLEMPENFILEMIADWDGAGRAITGKSDPVGWYEKNKEKMLLHQKTRSIVEYLLMTNYRYRPYQKEER